MGVELGPVKAMLDQSHPSLPTQRGQNSYTLGEMGGYNIVIVVLLEIETNSAATVAIQLLNCLGSTSGAGITRRRHHIRICDGIHTRAEWGGRAPESTITYATG
jgi:hypothetical protein